MGQEKLISSFFYFFAIALAMSPYVSDADDEERTGALPYNTVEFKLLDENHPILMDIYSPSLPCIKKVISLPVVMFFHGGYLTAGDRTSFLPEWLISKLLIIIKNSNT